MPWTDEDIPTQAGRVAIVTGANSGIGLEAAKRLAARGAEVVLACRNVKKGEEALAAIRRAAPDATLRVESLDLASLAAIRAFAEKMDRDLPRLDLLVNNAGVMAIPRAATADGFEMQLGTNHLGHFALTGLLLPKLLAGGGRVVTVSSGFHRRGRMDFDDLMHERHYEKWSVYGQSKLANLLFMLEFDRRLRRAGKKLASVGAHPGYADTNLQYVGPELAKNPVSRVVMWIGNTFIAQSAAMGALPTLRAATDPAAESGQYFGPDGPGELRGYPVRVGCTRRARNEADASRLWAISSELTRVEYPGL